MKNVCGVLLLLGSVSVVLSGATAHAAVITLQFEGQVTSVDPYWADQGFAIGDPWSAHATYDPSSHNYCAESGTETYWAEGGFDIGPLSLSTSDPDGVGRFGLIEFGGGFCMPTANMFIVRLFNHSLYGAGNLVGEVVRWPTGDIRLALRFPGVGTMFGSGSLVSVPEPPLILLLVGGILRAVCRRRATTAQTAAPNQRGRRRPATPLEG